MNRIDVHGHLLPALDDGCETLRESLECLRLLTAAGYSRAFCTPHCGAPDDPAPERVIELTDQLGAYARGAGIDIELKPGGELRLRPDLAELLPRVGVPSCGNAGKYVLADLWEPDWPAWATRAVEWLGKRGYSVILAHPERMAVLLDEPSKIGEIGQIGLLFQGNLGPIAGADSPRVVALARRFLQDGRYFLMGTDVHRAGHLAERLAGLGKVEELVGAEKLEELTVTNPGRLWGQESG